MLVLSLIKNQNNYIMIKVFPIKKSIIFLTLSIISFIYGGVKYINIDYSNMSYEDYQLFDFAIAYFSIVYSIFNLLLYIFCKNIFERIVDPSDKFLFKTKFSLSNMYLLLGVGIIIELIIGSKEFFTYKPIFCYCIGDDNHNDYAEAIFLLFFTFSLSLFSIFMYLNYRKDKEQPKSYIFLKGHGKIGIYIYELFILILLLYSAVVFKPDVSDSVYSLTSPMFTLVCIWNILILIYLHSIRVSEQRTYFVNWYDFFIIAILILFGYTLGHMQSKYEKMLGDMTNLFYYESLLLYILAISYILFVLTKIELTFAFYFKNKKKEEDKK